MMQGIRPENAVHIAVVIPAFNVSTVIDAVLKHIPSFVRTIVVVDDGSTDDTAAVVERHSGLDTRIVLIRHRSNRGVGGAMITGFVKALQDGAAIIVKVDGDGQMPVTLLPKLIEPLLSGEADYVKGNRFRDFEAIRRMPALRRFGNIALSFLAKAATGYWNCFDPTNGFIAIRADVLWQIPLDRIDRGYFFETSMLSHLYLVGAVVREVAMSARYDGAPSSLSIPRVLAQFPHRLISSLMRRIFLKNFVYDFSVASLHLVAGILLLFGGAAYGGYNWIWYASRKLAAPTGTVVLPALMIMLGFQAVLSAIELDLQAVPRSPINEGPLLVTPEAIAGEAQGAGRSATATPPTGTES